MAASETFDLVVVGGGINGTAIARDAAGRGLSVGLVERGDLGGATSSASSKLAHGGLRYLEHYEFGLVRQSLRERERLLDTAPHLVRPLRFLLPLMAGPASARRSAWWLQAGLWLYDRLGGGRLARSGRLSGAARRALDGVWADGVGPVLHYADAWADDARLVVANAQDAAARGARILPRRTVMRAELDDDAWTLTMAPATAAPWRCKALVNATGPWAAALVPRLTPAGGTGAHATTDATAGSVARRLRPVRGSHIVVPRCLPGGDAALLQHPDGRVVFLLPFLDAWTLVGTTEVDVADADSAEVSAAEIDYLCAAASRYLRRPLTPADVVWSFAGVRPLFDAGNGVDSTSLSRDYHLERTAFAGGAVRLDVFGGKLTTHRSLAETVLDRLAGDFPQATAGWTAGVPLPGGDLPPAAVCARLYAGFPDWPRADLARLAARYGSLAVDVAETCGRVGRQTLAPGLLAGEVDYLFEREWALTPEDVLWRRTKTGVGLLPAALATVSAAIAARLAVLQDAAPPLVARR